MNLAILTQEVQQFITDNLNADVSKLILKGSSFSSVTIQELANQIIAKQKSKHKLATWFLTANIYYPPKISIEQTSSEITASYKANLIQGKTIIDLTGGFGVDCFYFAKQFNTVIHCEINPDLSEIVKYNSQQLSIKNITTFSGDGIEYVKKTAQTLDCIYIDPSRRNDAKGKVFLLKDCLPNVPKNLSFLLKKTNQILIKNSPILDITSAINELKYVKEIHVVAVKNEVKELLFLLEKNYDDAIKVKTVNILKDSKQLFNFTYNTSAIAEYSKPLTYLYEPNAAILKSGGFHQLAAQLGVFKLHQHSHLYTSDTLIDFPGRAFKVVTTIPYNKKKVKSLVTNNQANITTRNFPKTVALIRKETKIKDGGNSYLFFTTLNTNELVVISCVK